MNKITALFVLLFSITATGICQQAMPLPTDPNVRQGVLDNGLTYFIRHNEKPAQRANFYIAQKVGSILEEENQRGLAHFLEHMAFNGTKNFPDKNLLDYMQRNGVKFGENVNAWTSIESTVYMLTNVPTTNANLVDSCLLVLHDWSSFISLESEEIDKERGVILEEMRQSKTSQLRTLETLLPQIYPNSPYGHRLPIGTEEVVSGFEHQALRDYYHKWYRPDLQGIIIIGDIDVNVIEARIKEMFADIPAPVNPAERTYFQVADNEEPIVAIATDNEESRYTVSIFYKHDTAPTEIKGDVMYWISTYVNEIISQMYNGRLNELTMKANPPFAQGYGYYSSFYISDTKDAWSSMAISKDAQGIDEAITAIIQENNRMKQHGFTESEYARARAEYLKHMESQYEERNKQDNERLFSPILAHFLNNEPLMGIENEFGMLQQIAPNLPLEIINQYAQQLITDKNIVVTLTAPQKDGEVLPTSEELLAIIDKANAMEVEPYVEEVSNEPLIAVLPKSGKVTGEKKNEAMGTTEWTLSNGIKVIVKPTTFKDDEILMSAYSFGGLSTLKRESLETVKSVGDLITLGGVGNFSAIDLNKALAGKKVRVAPYIEDYTEGFQGSASAKDIETMMQLINLYFNTPRSDEEAFQSYITRTKAAIANLDANPMITFSDSLIAVMYDNHPLATRMKAEDLDKVDYKKAMEIYKNRFKDPNNFVFTFVGNIDITTFKPMVETYLGSLKAKKSKDTWTNYGSEITNKDRKCHYEKEMETPKSTVYMTYNGEIEYTLENIVYMKVLESIMDIVYTEKIREDEGGTYGVGVSGRLKKIPQESFVFLIGFDTNKEMTEKLMNIAKVELENVAKVGPRQQDLQKVVEFELKKRAEELDDNKFWLKALNNKEIYDINLVDNYNKILENMTIEKVADFAKIVINGHKKEVVQNPK